jgi:prepilin-type processing-associated H-X9-DG protein
LIELLVVVSIIALLISILLPSLSRARDQGKGVVCLARLHEFGTAFASYENANNDSLPPALWSPGGCKFHMKPIRYGWEEAIFSFVYRESFKIDPDTYFMANGHEIDFPVQRNLDPERWAKYFLCKASSYHGTCAGHYRVYLPTWAAGTYSLNPNGTFDAQSGPDPTITIARDSLSPKAMLLGDSNELSHRGDGDLNSSNGVHNGDDCSYIDAGEANEAGPKGSDGNRFSDRHYGGTNYLFQDFHAEWQTKLREKLARDWDQNGVNDVDYQP